MERKVLLKFKEIFEEEKKNLLYSHNVLDEDFFVQEDDLSDETDRTSSEMEQSMRIRLRNREALYLKKIDAALDRIKKGTFGECIDCGDEIEVRRLEARPITTLCVSCKEVSESHERSFADGLKGKSARGKVLRIA